MLEAYKPTLIKFALGRKKMLENLSVSVEIRILTLKHSGGKL